MPDKQATQKQTSNQENDENGGPKPWRPTDNQDEGNKATEYPTGGAGQSSASEKETGDPGRTPGKAEGEDFDQQFWGKSWRLADTLVIYSPNLNFDIFLEQPAHEPERSLERTDSLGLSAGFWIIKK